MIGDFPYARFQDYYATTLGSYTDMDLARDKYMNTNKHRKIVKVADTFDLLVKNVALTKGEAKGEYQVHYSIEGPTKVLKEVLTSLFGNDLPGVVAAREMARPIVLSPAVDPEA